jgi:hypothetical protein
VTVLNSQRRLPGPFRSREVVQTNVTVHRSLNRPQVNWLVCTGVALGGNIELLDQRTQTLKKRVCLGAVPPILTENPYRTHPTWVQQDFHRKRVGLHFFPPYLLYGDRGARNIPVMMDFF